ncbi:MAG: TolC family protein [Bacteroidota bacterium]
MQRYFCFQSSITLLMISLLVRPLPALAEEPREITLDAAISLALKLNKQLSVAQLEMEKARAKYHEALGGALPKLSGTGQYTRNIKSPVFFLPNAILTGGRIREGTTPVAFAQKNSYLGSISLSQPLFIGQVYEGISIASTSYKLALESYESAKTQTVLNVKRAFYGVLLAREAAALAEMSLKNAEENLKNVQRMNSQGLVSDYDLIRARVQVDNLRPYAMQAHDQYELSKNYLKMAIGLSPDEPINVLGDLSFAPKDSVVSVEDAQRIALANNYDLRQLEFRVELAQQSVTLEKYGHYPSLVAFGNYQWQAQADNFQFSEYLWAKSFVLGVQLQIPIFNGFQTASRVQQAEITFDEAKKQRDAFVDKLKTDVASIVYRVQQARKRVEAQTQSIGQAEKAYQIAKSRYNAGLGTQLEVNDAEVAMTQSKVNYLQAVYDYLIAQAELDQVLGKQVSLQ